MSNAESSESIIEFAATGIIEKIHDMELVNRRLKLREIVKAIDILYSSVVSIWNHHLLMRKLSARWVSRLPMIDYKRNCVRTSECLVLFNSNPLEFLGFHNLGRNKVSGEHTENKVGFAGQISTEGN